MDLFSDNLDHIELELPPTKADFYPNFLSKKQADYLLKSLIENVDWNQEYINFMGKVSPIPRLTYWYSKENREYTYSGIKVLPIPFPEAIKRLNKLVEEKSGYKFNSVLLNFYRNGDDKVSWHADDEKSLGEVVNIASISVGAERDFQFKSKHNPDDKKDINLTHGSLLVMHNPIQEHWLHQIPVRKKVSEPRINLTFRYIP
jgi:alkylated DNA repair dioxygenase AlkB